MRANVCSIVSLLVLPCLASASAQDPFGIPPADSESVTYSDNAQPPVIEEQDKAIPLEEVMSALWDIKNQLKNLSGRVGASEQPLEPPREQSAPVVCCDQKPVCCDAEKPGTPVREKLELKLKCMNGHVYLEVTGTLPQNRAIWVARSNDCPNSFAITTRELKPMTAPPEPKIYEQWDLGRLTSTTVRIIGASTKEFNYIGGAWQKS